MLRDVREMLFFPEAHAYRVLLKGGGADMLLIVIVFSLLGTLYNLTNPRYFRSDRLTELIRVPEGIPLGATGKEDTLFVS